MTCTPPRGWKLLGPFSHMKKIWCHVCSWKPRGPQAQHEAGLVLPGTLCVSLADSQENTLRWFRAAPGSRGPWGSEQELSSGRSVRGGAGSWEADPGSRAGSPSCLSSLCLFRKMALLQVCLSSNIKTMHMIWGKKREVGVSNNLVWRKPHNIQPACFGFDFSEEMRLVEGMIFTWELSWEQRGYRQGAEDM